jgi:hypothetical protein
MRRWSVLLRREGRKASVMGVLTCDWRASEHVGREVDNEKIRQKFLREST